MRRRPRFAALWSLAACALLIPIGLILAYAALSYRAHVRAAEDRVIQVLDLLHEHGSKVFDTYEILVSYADELLRDLTDEEVRAQEGDINARLVRFREMLPQVQDIWVLNAEGLPLVSANVHPMPRDLDLSDRDYARAILQDGATLYISDVIAGRVQTEARFFQFTRPRTPGPDGRPRGLVAVSVKPGYFVGHYAQTPASGLTTASLVREDGYILARHPTLPPEQPRRVPGGAFQQHREADPLRGIYTGRAALTGKPMLIAYRRLPSHPVYVIAGLEWTAIRAAWLGSLRLPLLFGVPGALALFALALIALRQADTAGRTLEALTAEKTRREAAESESRLTAAQLGAWFEHAAEHLFAVTVEPDGRFTMGGLNPAYERAANLRREDVRGRPIEEIFAPDIARAMIRQYQRCISTGAPINYEKDRDLPGGRRRWETLLVPVRDPASGRITLILGSSRDVTEQRRSQAREAQRQRLEALGQLAGGIAHDFNNVMQAVQSAAGLIRRRAGDPAAVDNLARLVEDATRRGASVTRRLLAFARRDELRAEAVEPAALLTDVREVLTHTLGPNIEVRIDLGPSLVPLLADKGQLETVLLNLATNARDAMPEGGLLTLSAATETVGEGHPAGLPPGRYLRLAVGDTGEGMPPEVLARASEPFFTTKERGKGTGLGLAMARGFAEQSGGSLTIRSAPSAGTIVTLWLPEAMPARDVVPDGVEPTRPMPITRVLLVDDEELVREALADSLEERGFAVARATHAAAALAMLDAGLPTDLLLCDFAMPGMDGVTLIAEAQRRRPGLPAVLLTGDAGGPGLEPDAGFTLLRKPVAADELARQLRAVLAKASPALAM
ncbi:MAG: PAS domain-containing protein [Acetobacteraceae bacterium]|nr:PAS domain-containing protein [Acetobacteraceae bacterium]